MSRSESLKAHCAKPEVKAARSAAQKQAWDGNKERRKKSSDDARKQGSDPVIIAKRKESFANLPILECKMCGLKAKSHTMTRHTAKCGTKCSVQKCEDSHHMKGYCRHHFKMSHAATYYGISMSDMLKIFKRADGKCEICKKELVLHGSKSDTRKNVACIDHCHDTKKVRGILCFNCNSGLGHFSDSTVKVKAALKYLNRSSK